MIWVPCASQWTFFETEGVIITTHRTCHPTVSSITQAEEFCIVSVNEETEEPSKQVGMQMIANQMCSPLFQLKDAQAEQRILP